MVQVTLEQADRNLAELVRQAQDGEEVLITRESGEILARLTHAAADRKSSVGEKPRVPGLLHGSVLYMADDFDAPLDDF